MSSIRLLTNQQAYEALHRLADGRAASVKVDRETLAQILIDHAVMVRTLRDRGVRIVEPVTLRKR